MNKKKSKATKVLIFKNIKYFMPLIFKESKMMPVVIFLKSFLLALQSLVIMYFPKILIDLLIMENKDEQARKIFQAILIFAGINLLLATICRLLSHYIVNVTDRTKLVIDKMFNEKIASIEYYHLEDPKFIDNFKYAVKGMNELTDGVYTLVNTFNEIFTNIFVIIGALSTFFIYKEYTLLIFLVLDIVIKTLANIKVSKIDFDNNKALLRTESKSNYYADEIYRFNGQKNLRMYDCEELLKDKADKYAKEYYNIDKQFKGRKTKTIFLSNLSDLLFGSVIVLLIIGYSIYSGKEIMTIAVLTLLLSIMHTLSNGFAKITYALTSFKLACDYQNYFIDIMNMETSLKKGTLKLEAIESIEFKNVTFKYPRTDENILENVSFKIGNKQKISLIGVNGAGKTTLIKLLFRFYDIDSGEILINGLNIKEYDYDELIKQMSVVFQDFVVPSFEVKGNVEIDQDNQTKLYETFKKALIYDRIMELPQKEHTYINKWFDRSGVEFSGGELQKLAFSRALYKDASFVILDEPTSALDPVAEAKIYYHFKDIVGERLTLYISHRLSSCRFSDRILVLNGNKIVEDGTHDELIKIKDGFYYKMFKAQAQYYND